MSSDVYGQPKKQTSPWMWVGIGCGVMLVAAVGFVAFIVIIVFGAMRSAAPYKDALARAQSDPRVIELLGSPVQPGYLMSGSINTQNDSGEANLAIPISGPKGKGTVKVVGTKKDGKWIYQEMRVVVKDQEINLLEESPGTAPPTS